MPLLYLIHNRQKITKSIAFIYLKIRVNKSKSEDCHEKTENFYFSS